MTKAKNFKLPDQNNKIHQLSDYKGKWVVVYFYPKNNTPGCTKEACSFRDGRDDLEKAGVVVLGISKDSVASHKKFVDKFNLNFTLLSDPDHKVIEEYGAWQEKSMFGKKYWGIKRMTFLINPQGEIAKVYKTVKVAEHAQQILKDLEKLNS
jgi:peroxiredoxin Q/BCP